MNTEEDMHIVVVGKNEHGGSLMRDVTLEDVLDLEQLESAIRNELQAESVLCMFCFRHSSISYIDTKKVNDITMRILDVIKNNIITSIQ